MAAFLNFKKIVAVFLIFSFILPLGLISFPQKTEAMVPVMELGPALGVHTGNLGTNIGSLATHIARTLKEYGLDTIAWMVAKMMIRTLTNQIISWIQTGGSYPGGGSGSMFVGDIGGYLLSVANNTGGLYLERLLDPEIFNLLCTPFRVPLFNSLRSMFLPPPFPRARCTITDITRNIINIANVSPFDFYTPRAYWNAVQLPQNNIYDSFLTAYYDLGQKVDYRTQNAQSELSFGQGFLSFKTKDMVNTGKKQCVKFGAPYSAPNYTAEGNCLEWAPIYEEKERITTPGKLVEDHLATTLGSEIRQLELADELNEIIAAVIGALINGVLFGGSSGGVSGFVAEPVSIPPALIEETKIQPIQTIGSQGINPLDQIIGYKQSEIGYLKETLRIYKELLVCLNEEIPKLEQKKNLLDQQISSLSIGSSGREVLEKERDNIVKEIEKMKNKISETKGLTTGVEDGLKTAEQKLQQAEENRNNYQNLQNQISATSNPLEIQRLTQELNKVLPEMLAGGSYLKIEEARKENSEAAEKLSKAKQTLEEFPKCKSKILP